MGTQKSTYRDLSLDELLKVNGGDTNRNADSGITLFSVSSSADGAGVGSYSRKCIDNYEPATPISEEGADDLSKRPRETKPGLKPIDPNVGKKSDGEDSGSSSGSTGSTVKGSTSAGSTGSGGTVSSGNTGSESTSTGSTGGTSKISVGKISSNTDNDNDDDGDSGSGSYSTHLSSSSSSSGSGSSWSGNSSGSGSSIPKPDKDTDPGVWGVKKPKLVKPDPTNKDAEPWLHDPNPLPPPPTPEQIAKGLLLDNKAYRSLFDDYIKNLDRKRNMKTSQAGLDFIKNYEGFGDKPYIPVAGDKPTIGYGHKIKDGESFSSIDKKTASDLFMKDIKNIEDGINKNYEGSKSLEQNQFDALVSLGINIGRQGLMDSKIFKISQKGVRDEDKILEGFNQYKYSKGKYYLGLERRRFDEAEMYLYGDYIKDADLTLDNKME